MIKVIKPRSRRNIECMNCGALLSYEKEDVKKLLVKNLMRRLSNLLTITTIISYVRNMERRFDWGLYANG